MREERPSASAVAGGAPGSDKKWGGGIRLQLLQHVLGAGGPIFARRLDVQLLDDAVFDDHRITLAALAHAEFRRIHLQADRLGEQAVAVSDHRDVLAALCLVPGAHDKGVVDARAGDLVDALALQLIGLLDEARQVLGGAGRRVGARHREQGYSLAGEIIAAGRRLRPFRRGDGQGNVGKAVANLNGHLGKLLLSRGGYVGSHRYGHKTCEGRASGASSSPAWTVRHSFPAVFSWRCPACPTRDSITRSSLLPSMTKMALSASASATSAPASVSASS